MIIIPGLLPVRETRFVENVLNRRQGHGNAQRAVSRTGGEMWKNAVLTLKESSGGFSLWFLKSTQSSFISLKKIRSQCFFPAKWDLSCMTSRLEFYRFPRFMGKGKSFDIQRWSWGIRDKKAFSTSYSSSNTNPFWNCVWLWVWLFILFKKNNLYKRLT